jgi:hypothetical protein
MDRTTIIEKGGPVFSSPDQRNKGNVQISPSEFLSLLGRFHERLDALLDDMRTLPEPTARHKAGAHRSSVST